MIPFYDFHWSFKTLNLSHTLSSGQVHLIISACDIRVIGKVIPCLGLSFTPPFMLHASSPQVCFVFLKSPPAC